MKKYFKYIILLIVLFIGFKVAALETLFIGNGVVLNRCTSNVCRYDLAGTTNFRSVFNPTSFNVDETYTFNLSINATTSMASPTLTDCGLNINGAYVSPQSRNSGRTSYECNADLSRCDSAYRSTIVWTATSNMSDVPVFIQCDMTPQAARYSYTQFSATLISSNGSVINSILDTGNSIIDTNNYNANQNNANRDSNSAMIGGKIDNTTNVIGGKLDSHANTITGKLQQIIDNITSLGSTIVSGISSTIQNVGNVITNKIGELIGLQEVCTIYYKIVGGQVTYGSTASTINKYLDSSGNEQNSSYYNISDYISIPAGSGNVKISNNSASDSNQYYCIYRGDKTVTGCSIITGANTPITINGNNNNRYLRISYRNSTSYSYTIEGDCQRSGILGLFNNFNQFVRNLFNPDTSNAHTGFNDFVNGFGNDSFGGVENVISAPLGFVNNMNSACQPINLTIPRTQQSLQIPCLRTYISGISDNNDWGTLINIGVVVVNGLICYRCLSSLFLFFHDLKDPHQDDLEVIDL